MPFYYMPLWLAGASMLAAIIQAIDIHLENKQKMPNDDKRKHN